MQAARIIADQLKKLGIKYVVTLPDNWLKELLEIVSKDPDFHHVSVAREDEGVGICAGLYLTGQEAVLMIQNSGLFLCGNALKSLCLKYSLPLLVLVSNRGSLEEDAPYHIAAGRGLVTGPFLKALNIPYHEVKRPEEAGKIAEAHRFTKFSNHPVAVILGKQALVTGRAED